MTFLFESGYYVSTNSGPINWSGRTFLSGSTRDNSNVQAVDTCKAEVVAATTALRSIVLLDWRLLGPPPFIKVLIDFLFVKECTALILINSLKERDRQIYFLFSFFVSKIQSGLDSSNRAGESESLY